MFLLNGSTILWQLWPKKEWSNLSKLLDLNHNSSRTMGRKICHQLSLEVKNKDLTMITWTPQPMRQTHSALESEREQLWKIFPKQDLMTRLIGIEEALKAQAPWAFTKKKAVAISRPLTLYCIKAEDTALKMILESIIEFKPTQAKILLLIQGRLLMRSNQDWPVELTRCKTRFQIWPTVDKLHFLVIFWVKCLKQTGHLPTHSTKIFFLLWIKTKCVSSTVKENWINFETKFSKNEGNESF